ncbi:MAG: aldo/keto reductase [Planctomycetota bacterium]
MSSPPSGRFTAHRARLGFGGWALGGQWGQQDDAVSVATLRAAIDGGVTLIDTAPGYGDGRSERLISETVRSLPASQREQLTVMTKTPPSPGPWPPSPYCRWQDRFSAAWIRDNIESRLKALGRECLDLIQLHTWTRAWNDDPQPLLVLEKLRQEGKVRRIGVCTPEQDQNCVIGLMRDGLVDSIQVVFNIFEQEPAAQLFPVAEETTTQVLVRVALDEGALTGKYGADHQFADDDFRSTYFAGDRLARTRRRVNEIAAAVAESGIDQDYSLADVAIRFAASPAAVTAVLVGMRTEDQVRQNLRAMELPPLPDDLTNRLRSLAWRRGVWYGGK